MLLLSDFGPYRPNQFGREKGMTTVVSTGAIDRRSVQNDNSIGMA